ncbi:hypothetical protein KTR66_04740 [Roseococcus sp. SDR]|uniref:hypothetical protein n=1 Tax=Roseococcus sp. SDR TaxID=2835532 RepID=UPI001BCBBF95|nr:hypothetical protein [Roseococcus sp. SDR]MBS7789287.1 hypothetical protein [Roseococcus sp. SDR]MBV1844601.1 hypothetical protein [Roseococcus sp. SDR]
MTKTAQTLLSGVLEHGVKLMLGFLAAGMLWVHTSIIDQRQKIEVLSRRVDAEMHAEIVRVRARSDEADARIEGRVQAVESTARAAELAVVDIRRAIQGIEAGIVQMNTLLREQARAGR